MSNTALVKVITPAFGTFGQTPDHIGHCWRRHCDIWSTARTGTPLRCWAQNGAPGGIWNWSRETSLKATWGKKCFQERDASP